MDMCRASASGGGPEPAHPSWACGVTHGTSTTVGSKWLRRVPGTGVCGCSNCCVRVLRPALSTLSWTVGPTRKAISRDSKNVSDDNELITRRAELNRTVETGVSHGCGEHPGPGRRAPPRALQPLPAAAVRLCPAGGRRGSPVRRGHRAGDLAAGVAKRRQPDRRRRGAVALHGRPQPGRLRLPQARCPGGRGADHGTGLGPPDGRLRPRAAGLAGGRGHARPVQGPPGRDRRAVLPPPHDRRGRRRARRAARHRQVALVLRAAGAARCAGGAGGDRGMTCSNTVTLGAYLLGALDPQERFEFEAHLGSCDTCRAELVRLAPLPGMLNQISLDDFSDGLPPSPFEDMHPTAPVPGLPLSTQVMRQETASMPDLFRPAAAFPEEIPPEFGGPVPAPRGPLALPAARAMGKADTSDTPIRTSRRRRYRAAAAAAVVVLVLAAGVIFGVRAMTPDSPA